MEKENCPVCSETWLISACKTTYYLPSDSLQYFIKQNHVEAASGCPKCDPEENWTYKVYKSVF